MLLNATSHETFTRSRCRLSLQKGLEGYDSLRGGGFKVLGSTSTDETEARLLVGKCSDQILGFYDALCAAVMMRVGLYRVFTFDRDFWHFGFEIAPPVLAAL